MKALNSTRTLAALLVLILPAMVIAGTTRIQLVGNITTVQQQTELAVVSANASEGNGNFSADKAIDNNLNSRWGTSASDPQWITLNLGSSQEVSTVTIDWEVASAAAYEIRGSNGINGPWTKLADYTSNSSADHRIDVLSISGNYQYVQMYGLARTTTFGYSIWEMDVYGPGGTLVSDADNDGVGDNIDQCPGTLADTPVGADGCEIPTSGGCQIDAYSGYDAPTSYPGMTQVWADEFNGTSLNYANWTHEVGTGCQINSNLCGWGNGEEQYYQAENTCVGNGALKIEAKHETVCDPSDPFDCGDYTSSRLKSQGKQSFTYGRIDFRAVLPQGMGPWPALWTLGESISSVGWPESGEIDVMEKKGWEDDKVSGAVHWDNNGSYAGYGCEFNGGPPCASLSSGIFADEFHVFSIVWDNQKIEWYLDGATTPYLVVDITPGDLSEFHAPHFLLMNIAVGGSLGGTPNNAIFPQKMIIDYVRVYQ